MKEHKEFILRVLEENMEAIEYRLPTVSIEEMGCLIEHSNQLKLVIEETRQDLEKLDKHVGNYKMTFGKRLSYEREKRNWSQKFAAEKLGISNTVLSNYERDYREPDNEVLINISRLYDASIDYLLTGVSSKLTGLSNDEIKIIEEIRKHPDLIEEIMKDIKKEIDDFAKWQKFKESISK